jgi:hypothetical protein
VAIALQAALLAEGSGEVHAGRRERGIALLHRDVQQARVSTFPLTDTLLPVVKAREHAGDTEGAPAQLRELLDRARNFRTGRFVVNHEAALPALPRSPVEAEASSLDRHMLRAHFALLQGQAIAAALLGDLSGANAFRAGRLASPLAAEFGEDDDN